MSDAPLRVLLTQPALPKYRGPVFRELAERPGIDLEVWYGEEAGLSNIEPKGYAGQMKPMRSITLAGQKLLWHGAQWQGAKRSDIDVLILSWNVRYLSLVPSLRKARQKGIGTVLWGHGYSKRETGLRSHLRNSVTGLAGSLLFYDQQTADRTVEAGTPAEKVFAAPNAIDQQPLQQATAAWSTEQLAQFKQEQGLAGRRVLLHLSRLMPENQLERLVDAMPAILKQHPETMAVVVGSGDDERARLESLIAERSLSNAFHFTGPIYDESQLAPWCLSSEVFVYPANIGLSLLHAFGYGLPVVTSNRLSAQNPEIVAFNENQNGLLYEDGDAQALATVIGRLLSDDSLRRQLAAGAKQTVEQGFNVPAMVDGIEAAIRYAAKQVGR